MIHVRLLPYHVQCFMSVNVKLFFTKNFFYFLWKYYNIIQRGKNIYPFKSNGGAKFMDLILKCSVCPFSEKNCTEVNGSRFFVTVMMLLKKRKNLSEAFILDSNAFLS